MRQSSEDMNAMDLVLQEEIGFFALLIKTFRELPFL